MMSMIKFLSIGVLFVLCSFFYFPFSFSFFPSVNTKMLLALGGLFWLLFKYSIYKQGQIEKSFFIVTLFATGVSFSAFLTMVLNNTLDTSYISYVVSMWVWWGAAYFVINLIKVVHGKISVELVCFYLIAVGVFQCLMAIAIDSFPQIKNIVNSFLYGKGYMGKVEGRLYGIGCALDVGGGRLSIVLLIIAYLLPQMVVRKRYFLTIILLIALLMISCIGNMIGRTAVIGLFFAAAYWLYTIFINDSIYNGRKSTFVQFILGGILIGVISSIFLYNINDYWKQLYRFGFEGFFSLVEVGRWEVHSNEMLKEGLIFPDNFKTWIIGDGYMGSPNNDPNYIGPESWGFYMNTDAGYSRFLFYFGIIGLGAFMTFMAKVCQVCMGRFGNYKLLFLMILLTNYIIWIKVSTDIFLAFAPFLCISYDENKEYEDSLKVKR